MPRATGALQLVHFRAGKCVQEIEKAAGVGPDEDFGHAGHPPLWPATGDAWLKALPRHDDRGRPSPGLSGAGAARSAYRWNKNGLIRDLLRAEGSAVEWFAPEPMPRAWLEAVHDPDYVAEVLAAQVPREKERRIGFPVTPLVAARAQVVPGGTWLAAKLALERGFAANTAGGSHHALATTGAGYCVFNDLALAAVRLIEEGSVERILIVDCDVHQGDGTAALTAGRPGIATYSIHAEKNFPARKARSTLDVPLPDGTGDRVYLETLEATLAPMLDSYSSRPDSLPGRRRSVRGRPPGAAGAHGVGTDSARKARRRSRGTTRHPAGEHGRRRLWRRRAGDRAAARGGDPCAGGGFLGRQPWRRQRLMAIGRVRFRSDPSMAVDPQIILKTPQTWAAACAGATGDRKRSGCTCP